MLTDPQCRNAKCPAGTTRVRLADAEGLSLEVSPLWKGWFWKCRFQGKDKRPAPGIDPAVGLAAARMQVRRAHSKRPSRRPVSHIDTVRIG